MLSTDDHSGDPVPAHRVPVDAGPVPPYSEWMHTAQYVSVRDSTRLALDIFRPSVDGQPVQQPLPTLFAFHRYQRSQRDSTMLDPQPYLQALLKHGYVVVVVDVRGGGASFGCRTREFTPQDAFDAYDIMEWFVAQPWCDGTIGMFGRSFLGFIQFMTAATRSPHLKALFPEMAMFDLYSSAYPGGVFRDDFVRNWSQITQALDHSDLVAPVDEDTSGELLAQALAERAANENIYAASSALPFRDSRDSQDGSQPYIEGSPGTYLDQVRQSRVAIYHLVGWYDMWPRDALVWYTNLDNPQQIVIGPWSHGQNHMYNFAAEHLRWYDRWLKGSDTGLCAEPPIRYYTFGAPDDHVWRTAWQWPLPEQQLTTYYFQRGPSGSIASINDGVLSTTIAADEVDQVVYSVDYSTTSGTATRWTNGYDGPFEYTDLAPNDARGVTYTSAPLPADLEVTGHPVVYLWIFSAADDLDVFVYLEEVDQAGCSAYVTEGALKASHRAVVVPPFNYLGLPYHPGDEAHVAPLPDEPVELALDLYPISKLFKASHRMRVTITCADRDNALTQPITPAPEVTIYQTPQRRSRIILPIIPQATSPDDPA